MLDEGKSHLISGLKKLSNEELDHFLKHFLSDTAIQESVSVYTILLKLI